jgi:uncharacterized RDD family membrane protein YckC
MPDNIADRERSHLNRLVGAVVNPVIGSVDLDELLATVDINELLDRIDIDRLLERIDLDRLLERIDMNAIIGRTSIGSVVTDSAGTMATSALDLVRRQAVGLDTVMSRAARRLLRRPRPTAEELAQIDGEPAGAVTRLLSYLLDSVIISVLFAIGTAVILYLVNLFLQQNIDPSTSGQGWVWAASIFVFGELYFFIGIATTGRTPGKVMLGMRVLMHDRSQVTMRAAFVRTLLFPFSFIFGLGFIGIVTGRERRAWHDHGAHTVEVYYWGDRTAELPAPMRRWIAERAAAQSAGVS